MADATSVGNDKFYIYPVTLNLLTSFTYNVTVFGADGGAAIYNTEEFVSGSSFTLTQIISAGDITAKEVSGYTSIVTVSGYQITVLYTPDISGKVISAVGDKLTSTDNIAYSDANTWYVITQIRTGNTYSTDTPAYDYGDGYVWRESASNTLDVVLPSGTTSSEAEKYLVRFVDADVTATDDSSIKGYYIQFADGKVWYNDSPTTANNPTQASALYQSKYLTYTATQSQENVTGFCFNETTDGNYGGRLNNAGPNGYILTWETGKLTSGSNAVFYIYPVTLVDESAYVDYSGLQTLIDTAEEYTVGSGMGQYSLTDGTTSTSWDEAVLYAKEVIELEQSSDYVEAAKTALSAKIDALSLNMPNGVFLRIHGTLNGDRYLLGSNVTEGATNLIGRLQIGEDGTTEESIYYCYSDGSYYYLLNYSTGYYLYNATTGGSVNLGMSSTVDQKAPLYIDESTFTSTKGRYIIHRINGNTNRYLFISGNNSYVDAANGVSSGEGYALVFEDVTTLPVTLNGSGPYYATINLPVAASYTSEVEAYTAKVSGSAVNLTALGTGIIPANVPVLLYSESASSTNLTITSTDATVSGNDLSGTTAAATVTSGENYVLGSVSGVVGFYNYANTTMPGFKAYYAGGSTSSNAFSLVFTDDDDLTAVDGIEAADSSADTDAPYYDLQGRKVTSPMKGQIYIQAGKKVRY